jgi:hypothetical protein
MGCKVVNYSHLFPTRYALELESLKGSVTGDTFKEPTHREDAKKNIKKIFEERYLSGKNKWFFSPLRVSRVMLCEIYGANAADLVLKRVHYNPHVLSIDYDALMYDPLKIIPHA